jgi:hypothetical protein
MSNEEDLKRLFGIVKKAADTLQANQQQLAQDKIELESIKASALDALQQLDRLPDQITANVTNTVRQATVQVAPAVARDLKGHLDRELDASLSSAKTHIASAAKIERQLQGALDGFDKRVYQKLGVAVLIVALGALLVMFLALYWQRSSVTDLINQKAQLQAEIPQLQGTADYLKKHGGNIQYTTCNDPDGAKHICFLIKTEHYYGDASHGFYAVPVGD